MHKKSITVMDKKSFYLFILLHTFPFMTNVKAQTMLLKETSDQIKSYDFTSLRKITFAPGKIAITTIFNETDTLVLNNIKFITFSGVITGNQSASTSWKDPNNSLQPYPNPASDYLHLSNAFDYSDKVTIQILSIDGKEMIVEERFSAIDNIQIDISTLPSGIYLCKVSSGKKITASRFLKK